MPAIAQKKIGSAFGLEPLFLGVLANLAYSTSVFNGEFPVKSLANTYNNSKGSLKDGTNRNTQSR